MSIFLALHPRAHCTLPFASLTSLNIGVVPFAFGPASQGRFSYPGRLGVAPKCALSTYMFFSQDWRERIEAENPDASLSTLPYIPAFPLECIYMPTSCMTTAGSCCTPYRARQPFFTTPSLAPAGPRVYPPHA
jgi:hypothetical protein